MLHALYGKSLYILFLSNCLLVRSASQELGESAELIDRYKEHFQRSYLAGLTGKMSNLFSEYVEIEVLLLYRIVTSIRTNTINRFIESIG